MKRTMTAQMPETTLMRVTLSIFHLCEVDYILDSIAQRVANADIRLWFRYCGRVFADGTTNVTKQAEGAIPSSQVVERNGGDDGTRTRGLCRDSLGINGLSATYILAGAAKSLKGTVGTVRCG